MLYQQANNMGSNMGLRMNSYPLYQDLQQSSSRWWRCQVALSFLLLVGAGLFVRSLQNLKSTDSGVALDNLVTFQLAPTLSGYDDEHATIFYRNLRDRLRTTPGVQSAALATVPILAGDEWDSSMAVEGHQARNGEDMQAFMNAVSPGYFKQGVTLARRADDTDPAA
jgi:hypothetical protein